jgi:hypothetical protein
VVTAGAVAGVVAGAGADGGSTGMVPGAVVGVAAQIMALHEKISATPIATFLLLVSIPGNINNLLQSFVRLNIQSPELL